MDEENKTPPVPDEPGRDPGGPEVHTGVPACIPGTIGADLNSFTPPNKPDKASVQTAVLEEKSSAREGKAARRSFLAVVSALSIAEVVALVWLKPIQALISLIVYLILVLTWSHYVEFTPIISFLSRTLDAVNSRLKGKAGPDTEPPVE